VFQNLKYPNFFLQEVSNILGVLQGVPNSLGFLAGGAKYPKIFGKEC